MWLTQPPFSIPGHPFVKPDLGASRAPCPALNSLANHGYLPRDGKHITFLHLVHALRQVYNLSIPLACFLALGGMFVSLRCRGSFTMDLNDLAMHNVLEHDASLVHADTPSGEPKAPITPDPTLLRSLRTYANDEEKGVDPTLTLADLAHARVDREAKLFRPLDGLHAQIGQGEIALAWQLFRDRDDEEGVVDVRRLEEWLGEERIFDWWWAERSKKAEVGLVQTRLVAERVADMMKEIRRRTRL